MQRPISDLPPTKRNALNQRVRLQRFLLASVFSTLYLLVLALFYVDGKLDAETLLFAGALVAALVLGFLYIFRQGLNLRFPDPSLTSAQLLAAVFTMLLVVYRAPETRIAYAGFFYVGLMFGMLRSSGPQLAMLCLVSVLSFLLVILARYAANHDAAMLRLDMLQLLVIAITSPWLLFIGSLFKRLQRDLAAASVKLKDIEEKARCDDLTGVYNRRALMVALEDAKHRTDLTGDPLSVFVIDIDFFKRFNDEFDHTTGDRVLRAFAQAVRDGLRSTDLFGRYGGEEFVQILPGTALAGALQVAERLRNRITLLDIPLARSAGPVTVSIGVAQYRPGEAVAETFARADGALYKAKQLGRNRVEC